MSFAGALAVLETHLIAAGATLDPAIADVAQGERDSLARRIDYWAGAIGDPSRMGAEETLTDRMFGVTVMARIYLPVRDRRETLVANIEADLYAASIQIAMRVLADFTLGSNCTALRWSGVEFGWQRSSDGSTWVRTATTTLVLDFVEQLTLSP